MVVITIKKRMNPEKVTWFDDYFGWLAQLVKKLVKKLQQWIKEE